MLRPLKFLDSYEVTEDISVPENVTLSFLDKGLINIADGVTLHIAGPLSSSPRQIFSSPTTNPSKPRVQFESGLVPRIYPQWWGAHTNGGQPTETTRAIQATVDSVHNSINPSMSQVLEFLPGIVPRLTTRLSLVLTPMRSRDQGR